MLGADTNMHSLTFPCTKHTVHQHMDMDPYERAHTDSVYTDAQLDQIACRC